MARARKTTGVVEGELTRLFSNAFAAHQAQWSWTKGAPGETPPWIDGRFPKAEAARLWRSLRGDILAKWQARYPRREHWAKNFFNG